MKSPRNCRCFTPRLGHITLQVLLKSLTITPAKSRALQERRVEFFSYIEHFLPQIVQRF